MFGRRFLMNYWGVVIPLGVAVTLAVAGVNWVMGW